MDGPEENEVITLEEATAVDWESGTAVPLPLPGVDGREITGREAVPSALSPLAENPVMIAGTVELVPSWIWSGAAPETLPL